MLAMVQMKRRIRGREEDVEASVIPTHQALSMAVHQSPLNTDDKNIKC